MGNERKRITVEELKQILRYDAETGKIYHIATEIDRPCRRHFIGREAFKARQDGYAVMRIGRQNLSAHRVAWALHYGEFPKYWIDHINHKRDDNRICNLRDVPPRQNALNRNIYRTNTSGTVGVSFSKQRNSWRAHISYDGKFRWLGYFENIDDAIAARKAAEIEHGYHPNHGMALHEKWSRDEQKEGA